jgi:hypothetical protein
VTIIAFLQEVSRTKSRNLQHYTDAGGTTYSKLADGQDSQLRVFLLDKIVKAICLSSYRAPVGSHPGVWNSK